MATTTFERTALAFALFLSLVMVLPPPPSEARQLAPTDGAELQTELEQYVDGLNGTYGISVVNLADGSTASVNAEGTFPTASMYKLLVMYRVFQAMSNGQLSLDDRITITESDMAAGDWVFSPGDSPTVGKALNQMITVSSNAAAYALTRAVGGWPRVISAAAELGMDDTVFTDDFWGTPDDFAHFFRLLDERALVSPTASNQMLDLLFQQTVNDLIPSLLPAGVMVAHKTGELPGVRDDGGIVRCPGDSYIIVVMSRGGDSAEEVTAEAQISRIVYDRYCQ